MWKKNWRGILFVVLLGGFFSGLLVFVHMKTDPLIKAQEQRAKEAAILSALNLPQEGGASQYEEFSREAFTFYRSKTDQSIALVFSGSGLWGPIRGVMSLEKDLKTLRKVIVLFQEETPGLGGKIGDSAYLALFGGKIFGPTLKLVKNPQSENEVEALSGATLTSTAFEKILNETYQRYTAGDLNATGDKTP